ncbi:hypothetical protein [Actinopolymorpha alba]|uniref:hypothetical protein n=1 Tax=Actinopolymorpha alba TaxID=533267 RepID=UPI00036D5CE3|nr:hypothetical protein [Actinopolymorpha alba]
MSRRIAALVPAATLTAALAVATVATTAVTTTAVANARPDGGTVEAATRVVQRNRPDIRVPVFAQHTGQALLDLRVAAPGTDWAVKGKESAVMSVYVDDRYQTSVVVTGSAPLSQQLGLGALRAGPHKIRLRFDNERSAAAATKVEVSNLALQTFPRTDPSYLALRYAPIIHGRSLAEFGDANQNTTTDTPLIAWHESGPASTPGHTRLTYSIVWSNEDGGTNSPALMARWGRTTDIEWVYALEVDAKGERVPGSDVYQAPNHETKQFQGSYDGDHAQLQTCTSNNNMCDKVDNPLRFFPSALQTLPSGKAREYLMDVNPWTYLVMAKELIREGKVEAPSPGTPSTPEVSDQRNYLYAVVKKTTSAPNSGSSWVGVALGVRLTSGETIYYSHHDTPNWSIQRDAPAATTVELPAGTTVADIAAITAHRVVVGTDTGASIQVTGIDRAFLLGTDYLPQPSFLTWSGGVTVTAAEPSAVLWTR